MLELLAPRSSGTRLLLAELRVDATGQIQEIMPGKPHVVIQYPKATLHVMLRQERARESDPKAGAAFAEQ